MNHSRQRRSRTCFGLCFGLGVLWLLAACESAPPRPPTTGPALTQEDQSIADLRAAAEAASPADAASLYLELAWAYFDRGDTAAAAMAAQQASAEYLSRDDLIRLQLLMAEVAIAEGDLSRAEALLNALALSDTGAPDAGELVTMARYCAASGEYICAANRQMEAAGNSPEHNNLIWHYMSRAPGLMVAEEANRQSGLNRGWWQLKALMLVSYSAEAQRESLALWQSDWPDHPAGLVPPDALAAALTDSWAPTHVGLVLPLSGPLREAGEAVRDGFIVAYLQGERAPGFRVSFYDAAAQPFAQLYEQMLADGVDLAVGPLAKQRLAELNELNPEIPVLALNYLDRDAIAAESILQLGLAVEDEASSIALRLNEAGARSVLVFHNYEDWSLRARRQLVDSWQGRVAVQSFTDVRTITESVGKAMAVEASSERHDELESMLGEPLEFLPRGRQDMDAVVALVDNVEANALAPALRFHFAHNLPVYASSQVIRGARSEDLKELESFRISELPWYLREDPLYRVMEKPFALEGNRFSSLHALGVDAFRISRRIGTFARDGSSEMIGSTGVLSVGPDGRFRRELAWGVIRRGSLQTMPPSIPELGTSSSD